jgi:hypothetical protein
VTVDHVNQGSGLQSLVLISSSNAIVFIPPFTPGTFDPVTVTFTVIDPNQPVDFTLRARSSFHGIFIRAQCHCTPTATVTEDPTLPPGGLTSFMVTTGPDSVTVDHVNAGSGLRTFEVLNQTNAVVTIPPFTPGTFDPVTATYTITDPSQPVDITLRARSSFHGIIIRLQCGQGGTGPSEVKVLHLNQRDEWPGPSYLNKTLLASWQKESTTEAGREVARLIRAGPAPMLKSSLFLTP